MKVYTKPAVSVIGSLHELTLGGGFNKIGGYPDVYSAITPIVGSIVPTK